MEFPFEVGLQPREIERLIKRALKEDIGDGDITTALTVPRGLRSRGYVVLKQDGVIAGLPVLEMVFRLFDRDVVIKARSKDGRRYRKGKILAVVEGKARSLLTCERVALNFLQRLSGIATLTREFVEAARGSGVRIVDTRKTTPGLRMLEKYAVRMGGGSNHRPRLSDLILIKDNHIKAAGGIHEAIERVRRHKPGVGVEVEVGPEVSLDDLVTLRADIIMLDNWPLSRLRLAIRTIKQLPRRPLIEVSGGMNLSKVRRIARLGPDFISVGSLTHSAPALDISMDF